MTKIKPTLSKGTRDFLPQEVAKRNYIFETIKSVFRKYGFEQIETPAIERLETLTGKYGEEGDKLLFKILNSGDYLADVRTNIADVKDLDPKEVTPLIAEKGLRYDLTVPLARYVVQHQEKLAFPFKRFHIGPVWRADRPQKGRYQEFYQCDADVIGSTSLLNEVELTKIYAEVFQKLGLDVVIHINHRKILEAIAHYYNCENRFEEFVTILDKLDKIGYPALVQEYKKHNIEVETTGKHPLSFFWTGAEQNSDSWESFFSWFKGLLNSSIMDNAVAELSSVLKHFDFKGSVKFDCSLARGLNYYTGVIWEVKAKGVQMGSIASGGRYDNLTEMFGGQNMSGVGISFGIERIYDVMEELNLFPASVAGGVKVLFVPRDKSAEDYAFLLTQQVRDAGHSAEIFLGNVKKQRQFNYAEQKSIQYIVEIGENEVSSGNFRLRHVSEKREIASGITLQELLQQLQKI